MEYLSLMEHLELNIELGTCDKGTYHLGNEMIIRQRNGSSDKGTNILKWGMQHLRVESSILVLGCAIYDLDVLSYAWMRHFGDKACHT